MYPELNRPLASTSIQDRRAAIAEIFTDPRNGRLPRTLVNRIWEKLMGRGFVAMPTIWMVSLGARNCSTICLPIS